MKIALDQLKEELEQLFVWANKVKAGKLLPSQKDDLLFLLNKISKKETLNEEEWEKLRPDTLKPKTNNLNNIANQIERLAVWLHENPGINCETKRIAALTNRILAFPVYSESEEASFRIVLSDDEKILRIKNYKQVSDKFLETETEFNSLLHLLDETYKKLEDLVFRQSENPGFKIFQKKSAAEQLDASWAEQTKSNLVTETMLDQKKQVADEAERKLTSYIEKNVKLFNTPDYIKYLLHFTYNFNKAEQEYLTVKIDFLNREIATMEKTHTEYKNEFKQAEKALFEFMEPTSQVFMRLFGEKAK